MNESTKRNKIMDLAKDCNSHMELYLKVKPYIGAMTYDEFVDYVNMLSEGDSLLKYSKDYSKVTASLTTGTRIEFRYEDEEITAHKQAV